MGLGKTVEKISLITLHKRPKEGSINIFDIYQRDVQRTAATLIITPLHSSEWISEINRHAPHLEFCIMRA